MKVLWAVLMLRYYYNTEHCTLHLISVICKAVSQTIVLLWTK